jgi:hypothetical protein
VAGIHVEGIPDVSHRVPAEAPDRVNAWFSGFLPAP